MYRETVRNPRGRRFRDSASTATESAAAPIPVHFWTATTSIIQWNPMDSPLWSDTDSTADLELTTPPLTFWETIVFRARDRHNLDIPMESNGFPSLV